MRKCEYLYKNGDSYTRLYTIWVDMKDRCFNKNGKAYRNYGQRNITVCDEWKHNFRSFKQWALSNGYTDKLTIDRINNDGNYEPSNCRWVDNIVQQNNKRNNHYITYKGETKTLSQWSKIIGIPKDTLRRRIVNLKWSIDKALTTELLATGDQTGVNNKRSRSVLQYTKTGSLVKRWVSVRSIILSEKYGAAILPCCKGRTKEAYGYIWKYESEVTS